MLVLSRKKNESIMIGDQIEVKIIGVEGDFVRIGINAPREVGVFRKEVYEAIQEENRMAVKKKVDTAQMKKWIQPKKTDEEK